MRPIDLYIYQGIGVETFKEATISQVFTRIKQFQNISSIDIDTSKLQQEGNDEWKSLELLKDLTSLQITDESSIYSTRFTSLQTALSKLSRLETLTLRLSHTDSIAPTETVEAVSPFEKNLGALHKLTTLNIDLTNFAFGQSGCKQLAEGIEEIINLKSLTFSCNLTSSLPLKDIELLCQSATRSKNIIHCLLGFKVSDTTSESDIFKVLTQLKTNMMNMSQLSFVQITGKINQTMSVLVSRPDEKHTDSVYFNSSNFSHSYDFPKTYKIGSIYEKEARKACMEILQLEFNGERRKELRSITTKFSVLNKETADSILIFLQTLFLFLKEEDFHLQKLIIVLNQNTISQFNMIIEQALMHLVRVDILSLYFAVPLYYGDILNDFRQVEKINNINNLFINITSINQIEMKLLRKILLRKLKRLVTLQINKKFEGY